MTVVVSLYLAACSFPRPADVEPPCSPNEFIACEGSSARTCNATGDGSTMEDCGAPGCNADARRCNQCVPNTDSCGATETEIAHCGPDGLPGGQGTCELGCIEEPTSHCEYLEPRYLPDICDAIAVIPDLTIDNSSTFDTNLDVNCTGGVVSQAGGPPICVVRYGSIHITPATTLTVHGSRALALVADSGILIEGVLDVSANGIASGPGGGTVISGGMVSSDGGGGAGFATAGGAGGSATANGGGGMGGSPSTNPSIITVLVGGTRSARNFAGAPNAGGAGGAATLIACRGEVSVSGTIDAGGGGGQGGKFGNTAFSTFAGAGGGSGGNVVLQGLSITVTGQLFANGGGGGAGMTHDGQGSGQPGLPGADGTRSIAEAASGGFAFGGAGSGGTGGRQAALPGVGLRSSTTNGLPGGGGGSIGFFQTYTPTGIAPALAPSAASPAFGPNLELETR
jgi:hypothetical protein